MTINSPAAILLAMYVAAAEKVGIGRWAALGGPIQNDILKEYPSAEGVCLPARPSMRIVTDMMRFCTAECRSGTPSRLRLSHRGSRPTALRSSPSRWRTACLRRAAVNAGLDPTTRPPAEFSSSTPTSISSRNRQLPGGPPHLGPMAGGSLRRHEPETCQLRFHTQTAGCSLTGSSGGQHRPDGIGGARGGARGARRACTPNSMDEVLALPTEKAARIALPHPAVIAHEIGRHSRSRSTRRLLLRRAMTDELERQAEETRLPRRPGRRVDPRGVYSAIRGGLVPVRVADAA